MSVRFPAAVLAALLLLPACGGLHSSRPAPLLYRPGVPVLPGGTPLAVDLLVARPTAVPELERAQILTRWAGQRLDYFADARWSGDLPVLVQATVVEALQGSGRMRSVQGDSGRFRATHLLEIEVRRFEADYSAGALPVARVTLAATLGRQGDRRVLDSGAVTSEAPAAANRMTEVVAALDEAFREAVTRLAAREFAVLEADLATVPVAKP